MKKLSILIVFLSVGFFAFAQNLCLNPGFETATVLPPIGTPIPSYPTYLDDWTAVTVDGEFVFEPALAHTGNGFLSVLQNSAQNLGEPWLGGTGTTGNGYDRAAQVIAVSPMTEYTLNFWYSGGDGIRYGYLGGDMLLQVEEHAPNFAPILADTVYADGVAWENWNGTFTTGSTTTEIILMFSGMGPNNVDIWIDDIVLERVIMSGVKSEDITGSLTLYPNPTDSEVIVDAGFDISQFDWHLSDITGIRQQAEIRFEGNRLSFDTAHLAAGIYFLYLEDEKRFASLRFTVSR